MDCFSGKNEPEKAETNFIRNPDGAEFPQNVFVQEEAASKVVCEQGTLQQVNGEQAAEKGLPQLTVAVEPVAHNGIVPRDSRKIGRLSYSLPELSSVRPVVVPLSEQSEADLLVSRGASWRKDRPKAGVTRAELFAPLLCALPFGKAEEVGSFLDEQRDPPPPQPLLFLPLMVGGLLIRALLDSGASDSFISHEVVRTLGLIERPLMQPLTVRVANGEALAVTHFVKLSGKLGPMPVRLLLRVIKTTIPVV